MEEPPSVLDVEVFDFDGPFNQATSLEHAEINFLKHTDTELADMWVFLEGKLIQSSQSKLHLRIFWTKIMGWRQLRNTYQKWKRKSGRRYTMLIACLYYFSRENSYSCFLCLDYLQLNLRSPLMNVTFSILLVTSHVH
ncbi:hypothetical protein SAY86_006389 [Trapa natans]|uniref:Uncharacterized protein n=1 Tax=Trapa natans TaxID=22666 RepID=A0AAN7QVZ8_TRANT|nr:hypothetical protein SAY86_006389 [Trapa natans]